MTKIKFGTDGWRAIIAQDYTVNNVARVAEATALWLLKHLDKPRVLIGHDTRFGGQLFAETAAKVFCKRGIRVMMANNFVSTPMVSLGTVQHKADMGIVITASHNPPSYNGFKLKGSYGGPLLPDKVEEIERLIPEKNPHDLDELKLDDLLDDGRIEYVDLETAYCEQVEASFDTDIVRDSRLRLAYDAMYGAGQNVIRRLLPAVDLLHCENNPSFNGRAPEPIHKNLGELCNLIKNSHHHDCGLATDGDADRLGLYDNTGTFVDSNHIMLLLIKYLCEKKQMRGKVVTAFSASAKIKKMCEHFGLEHEVTKIGFKHIAGIMVSEDVLLGGEESGGIAVKGHIPERDGLWVGLTLWEHMAASGKSLRELIKDVYGIVGAFSYERLDLHLKEEVKNEIIENCKQNAYTHFGDHVVKSTARLDGYKYLFANEEWLMIRASGTEPVLRIYAETESHEKTRALLTAAEHTLLRKGSLKKPARISMASRDNLKANKVSGMLNESLELHGE